MSIVINGDGNGAIRVSSIQPLGICAVKRIVVTVGVPVDSGFGGIRGEEASDGRIVVAVSEQLQPTVAVTLVLTGSDKTERSGRSSRSTERVAERIVEHTVGDCLCAVGDAPRGTKLIRVKELACASPSFRQARSVHRASIFENGTCRTAAVTDIVLGAAAVYLLRPQVFAVVGKAVRGRTGVRDAGDAVLHIVSEAGDAAADSDGRAVAVAVIAVALVRASCDARQLVMGIVAVGVRDAVENSGMAVVVVIVSEGKRVA